jgi:archaellum component FlaC
MKRNEEYRNDMNSVKELPQNLTKLILDSCTKIDELETKIDELETTIDELKIDKLEIDELEIDEIELYTLKELAKIARTSWDNVYKVKKILELVSPEEIEKARAGEVSIDHLYNKIRQRQKVR